MTTPINAVSQAIVISKGGSCPVTGSGLFARPTSTASTAPIAPDRIPFRIPPPRLTGGMETPAAGAAAGDEACMAQQKLYILMNPNNVWDQVFFIIASLLI